MRASILAAVAVLSFTVAGQNLLDQIPKCAQTCFGNNLGTCGSFDIGCICGNTEIINSVSCCVFATCPQSDIQTTITFATNLCKLQNIQVNTSPNCPSNGTTSASSTASASASGSASASSTPSGSSAASVSSLVGSASRSASAAGTVSTAAAPYQSAGAGVGLGMAVAGFFALL